LNLPVRYSINMLKPSGGYRYRLVVDFHHRDAAVATERVTKPTTPRAAKTELLILIDPGHGGEDPGATGKRTYEKHVVLAIAKKLKARIDQRPGRRAELTRASDYYIPLRKRTRIAQQRDADLFISIHADAFTNTRARGASVYALSQRGASSETAKWLANKENAADLAGGINLSERRDDVAHVLLDLSMHDTVNQSISLGRDVLAELKKIGRVHSKRVEQAGFVVLKSPDIPSILVETAYITNPAEEKLLMSPKHQDRIAAAIVAGVERHIAKNGNRYAVR
ncbi:MAG: N-acetylmuramoyl-L-alanine amidase, partial [bacterium]